MLISIVVIDTTQNLHQFSSVSLKYLARTLPFPNGFHLPFQVISGASMPSLGLIGDRVSRRNEPINAKSLCARDGPLQPAADYLLLAPSPADTA